MFTAACCIIARECSICRNDYTGCTILSITIALYIIKDFFSAIAHWKIRYRFSKYTCIYLLAMGEIK